jgi:hypothetical protein
VRVLEHPPPIFAPIVAIVAIGAAGSSAAERHLEVVGRLREAKALVRVDRGAVVGSDVERDHVDPVLEQASAEIGAGGRRQSASARIRTCRDVPERGDTPLGRPDVDTRHADEPLRLADPDVAAGLEHPRLEPRAGIRPLVKGEHLVEVIGPEWDGAVAVSLEPGRIDQPELSMRHRR